MYKRILSIAIIAVMVLSVFQPIAVMAAYRDTQDVFEIMLNAENTSYETAAGLNNPITKTISGRISFS